MTAEQWLSDLEAKTDAATPGGWYPDGCDVQAENDDACVCCCNASTVDIEDENEQEANAIFIAAANPVTFKRLVGMIRVLVTEHSSTGCPHACPHEGAPYLDVCDACWLQHAYRQTEPHP